jgi:hypothetical protein
MSISHHNHLLLQMSMFEIYIRSLISLISQYCNDQDTLSRLYWSVSSGRRARCIDVICTLQFGQRLDDSDTPFTHSPKHSA